MIKRQGAIFLFVLLSLFWIILASHVTLTQVIVGFFASGFIVFYNYDLVFNQSEATKITWRTSKALIQLGIVLLSSMIKSNIEVAKIVLSRDMAIEPGFETIDQPLKKELNQAFYGNAITLTPGTLTVAMDNEKLIIHALNKKAIQSLHGGPLERAFKALEEVKE